MKSFVTISIPTLMGVFVANFTTKKDSPYKIIERIKGNWKKDLTKKKSFFADFSLGEAVPLHNKSGLRDLKQIEKLSEEIEKNTHIYGNRGLPNIKFVLGPNSKLILFDGHHSLLSYYLKGKKVLKEIPFIVVSLENYAPVGSSEIAFFFPEKARSEIVKDWEKYVINWQAEEESKLELRRVKTIFDLGRQLGKRNESSIEE
ncbi:MAG: hypothetical protein Q8P13_03505 [bacterium]|nr:hypothetical protein [bacterium]